jgi:hypothetical protein
VTILGGRAESAKLNSQVLTRVNPLSPNHRLVIALRSLGEVFDNRTGKETFIEKGDKLGS